MYLLLTDLHLDANPANDYRWRVFDEVERVCNSRPINRVTCLGDMTDKGDLFPASMVNRLVERWTSVRDSLPSGGVVSIMRGNHDTPVSGPAFWEFLSEIPGILYVSSPSVSGRSLLLPFSANPMVDWKGIKMRDYRAIFLHATVTGAIAENGFALYGQDLSLLPKSGVKIYSGDVHNQQTIGNVTYVGAPHPVKYGDHYACRFLLLDEDTFEVAEEVEVNTIGKRVFDVGRVEDLQGLEVRPGDQVKVRAFMSASDDWHALERAVDAWARERGVEASFDGSYAVTTQTGAAPEGELDPEETFLEFARAEEIEGTRLDVGLELLREALK